MTSDNQSGSLRRGVMLLKLLATAGSRGLASVRLVVPGLTSRKSDSGRRISASRSWSDTSSSTSMNGAPLT